MKLMKKSDEFKGEGEGDIYLEEICRDLGIFGGPTPLLMGLSEEGNKGGLLGFFGSIEVASEIVGDRRGGNIRRREEREKDLVWWGWVWGFVNLCCE